MTVKKLAIAIAIGWLFVFAVTGYAVWALAYMGGGTATVAIDAYGEAYLELVVIHVVVIPTISAGLTFLIEDLATTS